MNDTGGRAQAIARRPGRRDRPLAPHLDHRQHAAHDHREGHERPHVVAGDDVAEHLVRVGDVVERKVVVARLVLLEEEKLHDGVEDEHRRREPRARHPDWHLEEPVRPQQRDDQEPGKEHRRHREQVEGQAPRDHGAERRDAECRLDAGGDQDGAEDGPDNEGDETEADDGLAAAGEASGEADPGSARWRLGHDRSLRTET